MAVDNSPNRFVKGVVTRCSSYTKMRTIECRSARGCGFGTRLMGLDIPGLSHGTRPDRSCVHDLGPMVELRRYTGRGNTRAPQRMRVRR